MALEIISIKNSKPQNILIESFWVLERTSGICLFEENLEKDATNGISIDLICGFLSAISVIAVEAFEEDIKYIELSRRKLFFKNTDNFVFITSIKNQKRLNHQKVKNLIDQISNEFIAKFDINFERWDRNVYHFQPFSEDLKSILNGNKKSTIHNKKSSFIELLSV